MSAFYTLTVLVLAAYRVTRLIVRDDLPPLLWARDRLVGGWRRPTPAEWRAVRGAFKTKVPGPALRDTDLGTGKPEPALYVRRKPWVPDWLAELLSCPWCVSAYVAGALTAATDITTGLPLPWLTAMAVWAGAAILTSRKGL